MLLVAKEEGHIPALKSLLDQILETDFYVSPNIINQALSDAGEKP
jgi:predicted nucleic acid-binding protein